MIEKNEYFTFNQYIRNNELTPNEEDYIEMIYRLKIEKGYIKISDLANALNIKKPSVSNMIKKLQLKDIVKHHNYGVIEFTLKGEIIGKTLLTRHKSIESFLQIIGVKESIHKETEKIEHTISIDTLEKIKVFVEYFSNNPEILEDYYKFLDSK